MAERRVSMRNEESPVVLACEVIGNMDSYSFNSISCVKEETDYIKEEEDAQWWDQCHNYMICHHHRVLEDLKEKEVQFSSILVENRKLELKLQAMQEAGGPALRSAAERLLSQYQHRALHQRETYILQMRALYTQIVEQEHMLRKSTKDLNTMQNSLEAKQRKLSDLENFLERMEKERAALKVKKDLIEHQVRRNLCEPRKAGPEAERLRNNRMEICTLEEKICHLDHMVFRQSSKMRAYLKQINGLSAEVSARESAVESLIERLHAAQAQNVELKYKLEFWSSQDPSKNSLGMSV